MPLELTGSAFITGAGSGIGQSTALAFARHGIKRLALVDLNHDHLEETQKLLKSSYPDIEILLLEADVTDETMVQDSIKRTADEFKRIDIGVNCAGVTGSFNPTHDTPLSRWQHIIQVNQTGVWLCQKYLIEQMLQQENRGTREGCGTIINISSMFGRISSPGYMNVTPYTASKHAVMGMTKADAKTYAPMGIRINAICPGYVHTPMLSSAIEAGRLDPEFEKTPAGRAAMVEEISDAIVFLASPMASFMYGVGLPVDGGYSL